ncbi:MAG: tetratricopeptide repeat protein [Isosphaeraceae bacterium]|nr:tetratricopeptide repeat protein [Isosphaeraceae bacterium]
MLGRLGALTLVLVGGLAAVFVWPAPDPGRLWDRAITAFEAGRYDEAEAGLDRLGRLRAPTGRDWGLRARLAMARGRTDEALSALGRIPDGHPLGSWARLRIGQLELRRHRLRVAEAALRHALRLDPNLIAAQRELIYILGVQLRRRELDAAFQRLAERASLSFRETWIWCMVPDLIWWAPEENEAVLRRCLEADPDDRWSRLALAEIYRRTARYDDAAAQLAALPESDPDARAARAQLALEHRQDLDAAAALLANGPADHPGLARLRGRLAMIRHDGAEAVRQFRIVYAAEPKRHASVSGLGAAYVLAGDPEAARPYLEAAQRFEALAILLRQAGRWTEADGRPDLLRQLGAACAAVGRPDQARAWYQLVITHDPLDSEAQQALYRLRTSAATPPNSQ